MKFDIPGMDSFEIDTIILDLNGTIAIDGKLIPGVEERIKQLQAQSLKFYLFTGDVHGNGASIAQQLGVELRVTPNDQAKADEAKKLNPQTCASIGNGKIDLKQFELVKLRIGLLQAEGLYAPLLAQTDILLPSIHEALDLFVHPKRLIATLRK